MDAAMPPRRTRASKESAKKAVSEADTGVEVKDVEKETEIEDGGADESMDWAELTVKDDINETAQNEDTANGMDTAETASKTDKVDTKEDNIFEKLTKDDTATGSAAKEEEAADKTEKKTESSEKDKTEKAKPAVGKVDRDSKKVDKDDEKEKKSEVVTSKGKGDGKKTDKMEEDKETTDDEDKKAEKEIKEEVDTSIDDKKKEDGSEEKEDSNDDTGEKKEDSSEKEDATTEKEVKVEIHESKSELEKLEKEIPLPESFLKLRQLTVNIGPIKVEDLKSSDLHSILNLTTDFEIKFERKKEEESDKDGEGKKKAVKPETLGFVRLPFEIKTPTFFILIHNKLATLSIGGRDMSVKFPEQFNIALKDAKKYVEARTERATKLYNARAEEKKRSLRVRNLPNTVTADELKSLFPEAEKVIITKLSKGQIGGIMVYKSRDEAKKYLKASKDVTIEDNKIVLAMKIPDDKLSETPGKKGSGSEKQATRGRGGRGSSSTGRGGRGRGMVSRGRGGRFSDLPSREERLAKLRGRRERGRGGSGRVRGGRGIPSGMASGQKMADLMKIQSQTLARSKALMDRSPGRGNKGQFRSAEANFNRQDSGRRNKRQSDREMFEQERFSSRGGQGGSEENPAAMMAYLKSTLARMEEKISQKSHQPQADYPDERYDSYRGDKRKMEFDDYNRGGNKRGAGYGGYSDYDDRDEGNYRSQSYGGSGGAGGYGGQGSYGAQSGYGQGSYGAQSGYGQMTTFGSGSGFGGQGGDRSSRRYSGGGGGGNYGNQQWGGRY